MQVSDDSWMQHREWVCWSTEDIGLSPYQKTERTLLNNNLLSSSQLLLWTGDKIWLLANRLPTELPGPRLDLGQVRHFQATLLDRRYYAVCGVPCPRPCSQAGLAGCPTAMCPGSAGTHGSWCPGAACSTRSPRSQPCPQHRRSAATSGAAAARPWPDLPREDTLEGQAPALMASCQHAGDTLSPSPCHAPLDSLSSTLCLRVGVG